MSSREISWDQRRKQVYQRDDYKCVICGATGGPNGDTEIHAHHIIPLNDRGTNEIDNIVTLCYSCHDDQHDHSISRNLPDKNRGGELSHSAPNLRELYNRRGNLHMIDAIDINKTSVTHPKNIEILKPGGENTTLYEQSQESYNSNDLDKSEPDVEVEINPVSIIKQSIALMIVAVALYMAFIYFF